MIRLAKLIANVLHVVHAKAFWAPSELRLLCIRIEQDFEVFFGTGMQKAEIIVSELYNVIVEL